MNIYWDNQIYATSVDYMTIGYHYIISQVCQLYGMFLYISMLITLLKQSTSIIHHYAQSGHTYCCSDIIHYLTIIIKSQS